MTDTNKAEMDEFNQNYLAPSSVSNQAKYSSDSSSLSAVSWGAILAGAAAAAALALILLLLGTGLGLSSVSPWTNNGIAASTFGWSAISWLTATQVAASGMGGYIAGRLRTRWADIHSDEVYFRDTAHGFLSWAVASLATAALLTSVIGSMVGTGVQSAATGAAGLMNATSSVVNATTENSKSADYLNGSIGYFVSSLFRKNTDVAVLTGSDEIKTATVDATSYTNASAEIVVIFMNTIWQGDLPIQDIQYVGQLVSERTGLPKLEAEQRVVETYNKAKAKLNEVEISTKKTADTARKASAYAALWLFISLLIGAFVASLAATFGGRCRDN